jgi:hypothetical protein
MPHAQFRLGAKERVHRNKIMKQEIIPTATTVHCFVSMPFSHEFDDVFHLGISGVPDQLQLHGLSIDLLRLDKEVYRRRQIEENVLKHIDVSDLLIADITRYRESLTPNVSVMHEIGYACGKKIPVILIGKVDTYKELPSNLKGSITVEYDPGRDSDYKQFARHLAQQMERTIREEVLNNIKGDYQVECFSARDRINLPSLVKNAKRRIYILTTNLDYTARHLKDSIRGALDSNTNNSGFKVEILTMDPESNVANARAVQLGRTVRQYRDEIRKSLDEIKEAFANEPRVEIVTYRTLPTQMTYVVDDVVVTSVVSLGQLSRESVHFVINKLPEVAESFLAHFRVLKMHRRGEDVV